MTLRSSPANGDEVVLNAALARDGRRVQTGRGDPERTS